MVLNEMGPVVLSVLVVWCWSLLVFAARAYDGQAVWKYRLSPVTPVVRDGGPMPMRRMRSLVTYYV